MPLAEGKIFSFLSQDHIQSTLLETFDFDSPGQLIVIETKEFSAVCPYSGLPDYGYLKIDYYPEGKKCVELKSFKYYLTSFRQVGIYQEEATKRLYQDLQQTLQTKKLRVMLVYNTRGGLDTTCMEGTL